MKNFNNLDKKYCILVSVITIIGIFSMLWLAKPYTVGSEEGTQRLNTLSLQQEVTTSTVTNMSTTTSAVVSTTKHSTTTTSTVVSTVVTTSSMDTIDEECLEETATEVVKEFIDEDIDEQTVISNEEDMAPEQTDTSASSYIVYKPSTHYVHMSSCRWCDSTCYEITSTEDLEARKCSECDPDIVIVTEYVDPTPTQSSNNSSGLTSLNYITDAERIMLCNVVGGEYGSDWVSQYDKACVVACVMNRYYDGGWQGYGRDNTIYNVITAPGQFASHYGNTYYNWNVTDSCISAVEYYFENMDTFPHYTSFWGDGSRNHFS